MQQDQEKLRPPPRSLAATTNNITQQFLAIGGRQDFVSLAVAAGIRALSDRAYARSDGPGTDALGSHALEYGPVEGFPARDAIARRMSRMTGRRFAVDNILITTGAMQGLDLMGALFDPGDLVVASSRPISVRWMHGGHDSPFARS